MEETTVYADERGRFSEELETLLDGFHEPDYASDELERSAEVQDQSPVEEVALTVLTTDDPTIPVLTFRMWTLGLLSCVVLSVLNQFFSYRTEPLMISGVCAQIAVLPLGRFMAATLTKRRFRLPGTKWHFTLNPGPFNMKEHALISIFANAGAGSLFAIDIVTSVKVFYKKRLDFVVALTVVLTTQVLGFGWAGIFRRYLVEPATMWWPSILVQVSLLRALHEQEERPKGGLTRNQFFIIVFTCSFAYYLFPGYLLPVLTSLSWVCWAYPKSVLAQQLGSGFKGLGLGAIGLDWSAISSYLGSPLAAPWIAVANVMVGFIFVMYLVTPLAYFFNLYDAKTFPIFSDGLFTSTGQPYNISKIINNQFQLDVAAYNTYGRLHLSTFFVFSYGFGFATLTATIMHVLLFHGKEIWQLSRAALFQKVDIHTHLMRRYKQVPQSWFCGILFVSIVVAIAGCERYNEQVQLPWWGVILACAIAFFFTLPIGIIKATMNQAPMLNIISEFIIGYLYPGRPVANVCFKVYGHSSLAQALTFLQDFKLGHYMKIPPRTMFMAQVVATIVATVSCLGTAWYMIESIPNICSTAILPSKYSPWTCPFDHVFYDASVVWGLVGPRRIFGGLGLYQAVNWFFLGGAVAPVLVWLLHKAYPKQNWIKLINVPVLIGSMAASPPATAVNYTSWCAVGFVFSFVIFRYRKGWWQRHNYVLSGGLDAGLAMMGIVIYMGLGLQGVSLQWWGANQGDCPLASCPRAADIAVEGCPLVVGL